MKHHLEIIKFTIESLAFQNRHLNGAHSISDIKLLFYYFILSKPINNLSDSCPKIVSRSDIAFKKAVITSFAIGKISN